MHLQAFALTVLAAFGSAPPTAFGLELGENISNAAEVGMRPDVLVESDAAKFLGFKTHADKVQEADDLMDKINLWKWTRSAA